MNALRPGYSVEIDNHDKIIWRDISKQFQDINIYQTSALNNIRSKNNNSCLILKYNHIIAAASQIRIYKIPFINTGIAYIRLGPVWRKKSGSNNREIFEQILRAIRNEYVVRRGLYLRIVLNALKDEEYDLSNIIMKEGYKKNKYVDPERTIILDLSPSIADLRKGLRSKWRQILTNAEKKEFEIENDNKISKIETAIKLYKEMQERKNFKVPFNVEELVELQEKLDEDQKLMVLICKENGIPVSAIIWSSVGNNIGLPLIAATGNRGLANDSSYILFWKMVEWFKDNNFEKLDLGGINPDRNKGGYIFKTGIGKKYGKEVNYFGAIDSYDIRNINGLCVLFLIKIRDIFKG